MDKRDEFNVMCRTLALLPESHREAGAVDCFRALILGQAKEIRVWQLRAAARVIERIYRDTDFVRFSWELDRKLYPQTRAAIGAISTFVDAPDVLAFGTRREESGETWTHWQLLAADGDSEEEWNEALSGSSTYNGAGQAFNEDWRVERMTAHHVLICQHGGLDV